MPVCRRCLRSPAVLDAEYFCASCGTPFLNPSPLDERGVCTLCRSGLRGFDAAFAYGPYEGTLRELIHLYKYGKVKTLAAPLADFLLAALPRSESFDAVTAVPLHWRREWQRGFNQSDLLARQLARRLGLSRIAPLKRTRWTAAQAGLSNTARRRNVSAAFGSRRGAERQVAGKRILLIDDVMTTGSTAASCALALKRAGAARVALLAIARADRRFEGWRAAAYSIGGRTSANV